MATITRHILDLCLAWLLCPATVQAMPVIHKCVEANGQASYQNQTCAPDRRQAWTRTIESEPEPTRSASRTIASAHASAGAVDPTHVPRSTARASRRQTAQPTSSKPRASTSRVTSALIPLTANSASPACARARQKREETLERLGFKRTYAQLQKLDDAVHRACQ